MVRITNNARETLDFIVGKDEKTNEALTEAVLPGETRNLSGIDLESAQVKGRILAGIISVDDKTAARVAKAASEQAPSA